MALNPLLAHQAERNLVNVQLLRSQQQPTSVTQEGEMMSGWTDEQAKASPRSSLKFSQPALFRHHLMICPFAAVMLQLSCQCDAVSKLHLDTEHPSRTGRTRRLAVFLSVTDFTVHRSMRVPFSLTDVRVFACGAFLRAQQSISDSPKAAEYKSIATPSASMSCIHLHARARSDKMIDRHKGSKINRKMVITYVGAIALHRCVYK